MMDGSRKGAVYSAKISQLGFQVVLFRVLPVNSLARQRETKMNTKHKRKPRKYTQ